VANGYLSPLGTGLDAAQVVKRAYDEPNNRFRVDAQVSAVIGTVDVIINAATDNIAIADASTGYKLTVNSDGTINVNTVVRATSGDSIMMVGTEDGTPTGTQHTLKTNTDGSLATTSLNSFITIPFDSVYATYPNSITEVYTTKNAGVSKQLITITYTDATKNFIASAIRTDL
jgi:hypothetical protein